MHKLKGVSKLYRSIFWCIFRERDFFEVIIKVSRFFVTIYVSTIGNQLFFSVYATNQNIAKRESERDGEKKTEIS